MGTFLPWTHLHGRTHRVSVRAAAETPIPREPQRTTPAQAGGDTKRNTTMLLQREARPRRDRQTLQGVYSAGDLAAEEVAHALHLLALRADK